MGTSSVEKRAGEFWSVIRENNIDYIKTINLLLKNMTIKRIEKTIEEIRTEYD